MAQWVKGFADKPKDQSSIPRMHTVEGENTLPQGLFYSPTTASSILTATFQPTGVNTSTV